MAPRHVSHPHAGIVALLTGRKRAENRAGAYEEAEARRHDGGANYSMVNGRHFRPSSSYCPENEMNEGRHQPAILKYEAS